MTHKFSPHQKMMVNIGIGDAKGAGDEFRYPELKDYQKISVFDKYTKSAYADSDHFPGMYTDDTQMSIAVTELMLSDKPFTKENLADKFVECYKRDPIKGYAKGFQKFLDSVDSGKEFLEKIKPDSERNGAAMRAVPIGLYPDISTVIEYATINAKVTHDTPKGIASSVGVAILSHMNLYRGSIDDFRKEGIDNISRIDSETSDYLHSVLRMCEFDPIIMFGVKHANKGVPCDGMRTLGAVAYILSWFDEPKAILENAAHLGGDVDSVASISLGISMMHRSMDSLPSFLFDDLTNHNYGRDYLLSLGSQLEKKFPLY